MISSIQCSQTSPLSGPRSSSRRTDLGLNLPTEILLQITRHLRKADWLSLRLVSRSLYSFSANLPIITHLWYGPYSEDLSAFSHICNHPFLGSHVTTIIYDTTRFEEFSEKELRDHWLRAPRKERYHRRQQRKKWIENHPGILQCLKLVEEQKAASFDEAGTLTEGLKKLPRVRTIRLAFAFQTERLVTHKKRMSPLRRYSDVEWIRPDGWKPWETLVDAKHVMNIIKAVVQSEARVEKLDFWKDYMSIPLEVFDLGDRYEEFAFIFSRLTKLTIRISRSSLNNASAVLSFRKLLESAKELKEVRLCVDGFIGTTDQSRRGNVELLTDDLTWTVVQKPWTGRQPQHWEPRLDRGFGFDPPCPGTMWNLQRRDGQ